MWGQQVGERVKQLRTERNLTRAEFSELTNISERQIGNIERGTHTITVDVIAQICNRTGVSADYIIFGSVDTVAAISALNGLTHEQTKVVLDIALNVIKFISTDTGNNTLIQEVLRQHQAASV